MNYRILPNHLWSTADAARRYCKMQWGVPESKIQVESPITKTIGFVTTLHAEMRDHSLLCVEVAERVNPVALASFVLECKNLVLPVKLFVAIPPPTSETSFRSDLVWARKNGVGIIELQDTNAIVIQDALLLSLTGLRPDPKEFPARYRLAVSDAISTFNNGNPSKGCGVLYDELEGLTRSIAEKAIKKGQWKNLPKGQSAPQLRPKTDPWSRVVTTLMNHFDAGRARCPKLKPALFARILGVTEHRNEAAHKPGSLAQVQRRDAQLRTRFESVSDLLRELIDASKNCK